MRRFEHLPAPASKEPMQGVRRLDHLPAPAPKEQMQGVWGLKHLPAPAQTERMQGVRGLEHLPTPAHQERMPGVCRSALHTSKRISSPFPRRLKRCAGGTVVLAAFPVVPPRFLPTLAVSANCSPQSQHSLNKVAFF